MEVASTIPDECGRRCSGGMFSRGAVSSSNMDVLLVRRGRAPLVGYWSLPGGKLEIGESVIDCAVREIAEETNLFLDVSHISFPFTSTDVIVRDQHVC